MVETTGWTSVLKFVKITSMTKAIRNISKKSNDNQRMKELHHLPIKAFIESLLRFWSVEPNDQ
jgi:hypothetical protein